MALKNSKKHVELGLKGLGGQILTEGWINRSPETKKLQSVSCGQAAQEREGSSHVHKPCDSDPVTRPPGAVSSAVKWVTHGLGWRSKRLMRRQRGANEALVPPALPPSPWLSRVTRLWGFLSLPSLCLFSISHGISALVALLLLLPCPR